MRWYNVTHVWATPSSILLPLRFWVLLDRVFRRGAVSYPYLKFSQTLNTQSLSFCDYFPFEVLWFLVWGFSSLFNRHLRSSWFWEKCREHLFYYIIFESTRSWEFLGAHTWLTCTSTEMKFLLFVSNPPLGPQNIKALCRVHPLELLEPPQSGILYQLCFIFSSRTFKDHISTKSRNPKAWILEWRSYHSHSFTLHLGPHSWLRRVVECKYLYFNIKDPQLHLIDILGPWDLMHSFRIFKTFKERASTHSSTLSFPKPQTLRLSGRMT